MCILCAHVIPCTDTMLISFSSFFHASFLSTHTRVYGTNFLNCTQDKRDLNTLIRPRLTAIEYASHKFLFFSLPNARASTDTKFWLNLYFMHSNIDWLINRLYIWIKYTNIYCSLSKWTKINSDTLLCLFTLDIPDEHYWYISPNVRE